MWFLYKIINLINNKVYIGQTINPKVRWSKHKYNAKYNTGNLHLSKAIKKHGIENFNFEIVAQSKTLEGCDDMEIWLINYYNSIDREFGYNKSSGGQGKRPMSEETKIKLSKSLKGRICPMKGKHHSQETIKILSNLNSGNSYRLGVKVSETTKKLLSEINIGKKATDETKNKMSKSMIGKNKGEANGMFGKKSQNAKLTIEQAVEIRNCYKTKNISLLKLASKYGVSKRTIFNIIHNKIFKDKI